MTKDRQNALALLRFLRTREAEHQRNALSPNFPYVALAVAHLEDCVVISRELRETFEISVEEEAEDRVRFGST